MYVKTIEEITKNPSRKGNSLTEDMRPREVAIKNKLESCAIIIAPGISTHIISTLLWLNMRTARRFIRALQNPRLFFRGLNRIYHTRANFRTENTAGMDIFKEDWDTLIVLDACRYDMFEEVNKLNGELTSGISRGSSTVEWLQANFSGRDLTDTVYVTANPQLERNREHWNLSLHETINVWLDEGWDETAGTVLAETMTQAAIEAYNSFPDKRLVVHYMQPHYPFVQSETEFDKEHLRGIDGKEAELRGENVWNQKFTGQLSVPRQELWSIYIDNLKYVLDHVRVLLEEISGKTVITSDHGNYVGGRASPIPIREYGHPRGLYDDVLVRVPWLEYVDGEPREISSGTSSENSTMSDSDIVTDRLRDLGYQE